MSENQLQSKPKILSVLLILLMITQNIMRVIHIGERPFNIAISDIFVPIIMILLLWQLQKRAFGDIFYGWQWALTLVVWIVFSGVMAIQNTSITDSGMMGMAGELVKTSISLCYFFIGYNVLQYLKDRQVRNAWTASALVFMIGGILLMVNAQQNWVLFDGYTKFKYYFMGTYTDPNHAATFLGINTFVSLYFASSKAQSGSHKKIPAFLYYIIAIFSTALVLLTDSRGGLIAIAVALLIYFIIKHKGNIKTLVIPMILIGVILITLVFNIDAKMADNAHVSSLIYSFTTSFDDGLGVRESLSKAAWEMGKDHPLLGVGRGNYALNSAPYFEAMDVKWVDNIPHNTPLGIFSELGIMGVILYSFPIWLLISSLFKRKFEHRPKLSKIFLVSLMAVLIVVGIQSLVLNTENQRIIWFVLGMVIFALKDHQRFYEISTKTDTQEKDKTKEKTKNKIIRNFALLIVTGTVVVLSAPNLYYKVTWQVVEETYETQIDIPDNHVKMPITVTYQLNTRQSELARNLEMIKLEIVEIDDLGKEITLFEHTYPQVYGSYQTVITKHETDSKIYLRTEKIEAGLLKYYVNPISISTADMNFNLDKNYFVTILNDSHWKSIEKSEVPELAEEVNFENVLTITGIDFQQTGNSNYITLNIEALKNLDKDYNVVLRAIPRDLHEVDKSFWYGGFKAFTDESDPATTEWLKGDKDVLLFKIDSLTIDDEWYLYCYYRDDENKAVLLKEEATNQILVRINRGE